VNRTLVSLALAMPLSACGGTQSPTSTSEPPAAPSVVVTAARWEAPLAVADAGERPFSRCSPYTQSQCRLFNQATAPAVAVNARGQTVALWQRYEGDAYRLAGARLVPGGGWTEAERLSPESAVRSQQVVIDGSGNAVALWFGSAGSRMSRGAATGGWTVPEDVEAGSQLVMDASGTTHTLVSRWNEGLFWKRLPPGGAWSEPVLLQRQGPSLPFIDDPRLAVTPGGAVHAVWVRNFQSSVREEESNEVWASRMPRGQAWTEPTLLASLPRAYAFSPTFTATDSVALVSYRHVGAPSLGYDPGRIVEQHAPAGDLPAWTVPVAISEPAPPPPVTRRPERPVLASDARGSLTLAWDEVTYGPSEPSRFEIRARRFSSAGAAWEHAQLIESRPGYLHEQFELHVAASAAGDAVVLWIEQKSSDFGHRMWASVFVPGTGWSAPEALRDARLMSEPALAMDGVGNAIVMWSEPDGDRTTIWSARLAATTMPAR
jgi:hypothetical protein